MTGGWVAGVLFEAWRSTEHVAGVRVARPTLYTATSRRRSSISSSWHEREFLITTSLLDDVTAERAEALGEERGGRAPWCRCERSTCRWHGGTDGHSDALPRARARVSARALVERRGAERCHAGPGRCTCRAAAGRRDSTRRPWRSSCAPACRSARSSPARARRSRRVIDRLDYAMAEHWLATLADAGAGRAARGMAVAEMMLALGREDYRARRPRGRSPAAWSSERERLARESPRAAGDDGLELLAPGPLAGRAHEVGVGGRRTAPEMEAVRYTLNLVDHELVGGRLDRADALSGSPLDAW